MILKNIFGFGFILALAGALVYQEMPLADVALYLFTLAINMLFAYLLKKHTLLGRKLLDKLAGFQLYLKKAESPRIKKLDPPDMTSSHYEKLLPFAIALDVENEWSKSFTTALAQATTRKEKHYHPRWYGGKTSSGVFNPVAFSYNISSSLSVAISASSVSGSGGGGFSGGGGGGGGGGGW